MESTFKFEINAVDSSTLKGVEGYGFNIQTSLGAQKTIETESDGNGSASVGGSIENNTITYTLTSNKVADYYKPFKNTIKVNVVFDISGNIDIESQLVEDDTKEESKTLVSNDTKTGYDSYTPSSSSSNSSNTSNNTSSSNTSSNTSSSTSSNNNYSNNNNNDNSNSNNSNSNNSNKQEETVDKSAFNGKDAIISEGQPFNPMNALQLYACDITGENITNSIVITENNVDIYKPGVYNVKASIALKNGKTLDKKFAVRVEPTVLDLAVNDVKASKTELKKEENYTMNFAVNSSKSYIDVEKVVINKKEYEVSKILEDEIERYSVNLMAPNKAGYESLKLQKVIMSDKTVVDIDKTVNINVLKEDATLNNVVVEDESNENNALKVSFNLKDVDNTISEPKICIYDKDGKTKNKKMLKILTLYGNKFPIPKHRA